MHQVQAKNSPIFSFTGQYFSKAIFSVTVLATSQIKSFNSIDSNRVNNILYEDYFESTQTCKPTNCAFKMITHRIYKLHIHLIIKLEQETVDSKNRFLLRNKSSFLEQ